MARVFNPCSSAILYPLSSILVFLLPACSSPSAANIELRKQNADLLSQIDQLKRQHEADLATINGLRNRTGALPTLSQDRLDRLFTVGSIKLTMLTAGYNDKNLPDAPDTGVRAYVRMYDTTGDLIKAAGTFTVELFDLANTAQPLVAKATFPTEKADDYWSGMALVYSFVLPVPFPDGKPPQHDEITVKVTYTDELTQRIFTEQTVVKVKLPPTTQPTPAPAGS